MASATTGGGIGLKPGVELTEPQTDTQTHSKDKQGWPPNIQIPETGNPGTFHMDPNTALAAAYVSKPDLSPEVTDQMSF